MAPGDDRAVRRDDLYGREPPVLDQSAEHGLTGQTRLVFNHDGEHTGRLSEAARLVERRAVLHLPGLFDDILRQTIEPLLDGAIEEQV